ncbi:MAG TPA: hypothetical protein ENI56_02925 [Candidatus Kaiserbacteria bacterium]|nr:hypothetical protein [Candidatus Kaiserbacteria bacterium]
MVMLESRPSSHEPGENTHAKEARTEHLPEYVDIADVRVQQRLIEHFFLSLHPEMPLSDPDTRAYAAREWIGDPNDSATYAARFREYVQTHKNHSQQINVSDPKALDDILTAIGAKEEAPPPIHKRALQ